MSAYKPYPKTKPSGVEWLGDVPEEWEIARIKWSTVVCQNGVWGDDPKSDEDDLPCVRVADFDRERLSVFLSEPTIRNVPKKDRMGRMLKKGDLLIEKSGGGENQLVGCVVIYDDERPAVCSNFVARIEIAQNMHSSYWRYVHAAAYSIRLNMRSIKQTSGIQNLDSNQYLNERCVFPPLPEQHQIAAFLDRECGKLDALQAKQERLIELLKEKRQALISHAVTRGLDPTAKLKPSGIEWLGEVPEEWEIRKASQLFRAAKGKYGQMLTKEFCSDNSGEYPVYSGQTENDGLMGTWSEFEFDFGEEGVLFSTTVGSGKVMSLRQIFGRFSLSQNCMVIWPTSKRCATRFFYYHFQPLFDYEKNLIPQHMQASFRMEDFYGYKITLPPLAEQLAIVAHLDEKCGKIDQLKAKAERGIELLKERRSALISAAVTGKIDVRDA